MIKLHGIAQISCGNKKSSIKSAVSKIWPLHEFDFFEVGTKLGNLN